MMDTLLHWDWAAFTWVNGTATHPVLDALATFWREKSNWVPLYILLIGYLLYRFRWRALPYCVLAGLLIGTADFTSSELIKKQVERPRPCREAALSTPPRLLVHCGGGYSFTSSHATNHFAVATWLWLGIGAVLGGWRWLFMLWAAGVAYAQVYVGVHYPLDVLSGAVLGMGLAGLFWWVYRRLPQRWRMD